MKRFYFILLIISIVGCDTASDFPTLGKNYFVKYYGKDGDQYGIDFIVNTDGSIVMLGNTLSSTAGDFQQMYLVKVDARGMILWERSIGLLDKNDYARDIELHPDGRLIIVGETEMGVGDRDVFIKTLSADGIGLDSARVGLIGVVNLIGLNTDEEVRSVSIISDGFIVAGTTTRLRTATQGPNDVRDAMHLRFDNALTWINDATGNWSDVQGNGNSDDVAVKVIEVVPNSRYFVFGYTNREDGDNVFDFQAWVYQLNATGVSDGVNLRFGDSQKDETIRSVAISPIQSGPGYVLSGTAKQGNETQTYLVKISSASDLSQASKLYEEEINSIGTRPSSELSPHEGDIVTTFGRANETFLMLNDDYSAASPRIALTFLTRSFTDNNQPPIYFDGEGKDFAGQVAELPDGRILLFGTMTIGGLGGQQKMALIKLNADGKLAE